MKMHKLIVLALILLFTGSVYSQVSVIVNKSVSETSIDKSKLAEIYQLKSKTWSDGKAIVVFVLKADNDDSNKFYDAIGQSSMKMKKLWMKKQLTGEGQAPEGLSSDSETISRVSSTPGAIGYVNSASVTDAVKVLMEIK
jgi:ABC-type phosphate transport system substrate-binding protein